MDNIMEQRPGCATWVEIDLSALTANYHLLKDKLPEECQVLGVVKADAYGHGAVEAARALRSAGCSMFAVATILEGVELREAGIEEPVLIFGGAGRGDTKLLVTHSLTPCIYSIETAAEVHRVAEKSGQKIPCHLKFDTGMARVGFQLSEMDAFLAALKTFPLLDVVGVLSHLACADEPERPLTAEQEKLFLQVEQKVMAAGFTPDYWHLYNSAAILSRTIADSRINLARPGIALYGGLPSVAFTGIPLHPVMSWYTTITQIKNLPAGCGVSYTHRFTTQKPSRIALLPVGYADGYRRLLTNRGEVLIRGVRAPVAGTVCMDWIMVDITHIPEAVVGDRVVLLGSDGEERISAEEMAQKGETINYEVFCGVSKRVPRHYINGDSLA